MQTLKKLNQLYPNGNNPLDKYAADFNELVNTAYRSYHGKSLKTEKKHLIYLADQIRGIRKRNSLKINKEDIKQQLYMYWLEWIKDYSKDKKNSIRTYLLRLSIWNLRDWLRKEANVMNKDKVNNKEESKGGFLSLAWLLGDGKMNLSRYERYLLYLKYVEGLTILEISDIVFKHRETVSKELIETISKLRSRYE